MKKFISKNKYTLIGLGLFILIWFLLSLIIKDSSFIFPSPLATIKELISMLKGRYLYRCLYQTVIRMLMGFLLSFVLAFICGVFAGNYQEIEKILKPGISVFRSVPTASLVYLFLVLAGAKITPICIVVLISFPIIYESVVQGIKSTPESVIKASKLDGCSTFVINIKMRIPLAYPNILVGVVSSLGLSLKVEIMSEVITGYTRLGIGSAILAAQRSDPTNMIPVFAYSLVIIIFSLILDALTHLLLFTPNIKR